MPPFNKTTQKKKRKLQVLAQPMDITIFLEIGRYQKKHSTQ